MNEAARELVDRTGRVAALCELSQEMSLVEDEQSIYRVVLDVVRKVLDFRNCAILIVDERARALVMVDEQGYPPETRNLRLPLGQDRGISCWVAEHGEPLYIPDVRLDPRYVEGVLEARTELAVPIKIQDRTLGVLNVESDRVDAFDREEAMLLQALASQLAVALELHRARAALDRLSITDALTGVYNRRFLDRFLSREETRSERFEHPIAFLMLDLDDFKAINDRHGHERGDAVLVAFAQALQRTVRRIDAVVRYGGDEFLIVMLETDEDGARYACGRIRAAALAGLKSAEAVPEDWEPGVSVGLAVRQPGGDMAEKLRQADRAMYADKHGRAGA